MTHIHIKERLQEQQAQLTEARDNVDSHRQLVKDWPGLDQNLKNKTLNQLANWLYALEKAGRPLHKRKFNRALWRRDRTLWIKLHHWRFLNAYFQTLIFALLFAAQWILVFYAGYKFLPLLIERLASFSTGIAP